MSSPTPAEVRAARVAAGLTQVAAAALIGAALRSWEDWEAGRRNMPAIKWEVFCQRAGRRQKRPGRAAAPAA